MKKRIIAWFLAMCIMAGVSPLLGQKALAAGYESAWFPAPTMRITQLAYENASHGRCNAIDLTPGGDVFAPFTGKIVQKSARWGYVLFQSLDKVYFADGSLDYMTVGFMHDSDISNLSVGQVISQGTNFYQAGGMGEGNPNKYSPHVDISVFRGKVSYVSTYGNGNTYAYDAFFINTQKTAINNESEFGRAKKQVLNGAPTDWSNRWRYLTAQNIGNDFYAYIQCELGGFRLENRNGNVQTATANDNDLRQKWHFIWDGNKNAYKIINTYDGRCMDVWNADYSVGTNIQVYMDNGNDAQRLKLVSIGRDSEKIFKLAPIWGDWRLDVAGAVSAPGTNIQLYFDNNYLQAQEYKIIVIALESSSGSSPNTVSSVTYFPTCSSSYTSIVSALNSVGADSSYAYRQAIANANSIYGYTGSAAQNTQMLNLLKAGKLIKPSSSGSSNNSNNVTYFPACSSSHTSIVSALNSIGAQSSYEYRQKIAAANSISGYTGSAAQNTQMLNLLKAGKLIRP